MTQLRAYETVFHGEPAIGLQAGKYEAVMLPGVGGNLIAFRDNESGYRFLREPAESEMESFKSNPGVHGIPVLFPPNRYEDGRFPWKGKVLNSRSMRQQLAITCMGFCIQQPGRLKDLVLLDRRAM